MSVLKLRKDTKTGEPVQKNVISAKKAEEKGYLAIKAYDNERVNDDLAK